MSIDKINKSETSDERRTRMPVAPGWDGRTGSARVDWEAVGVIGALAATAKTTCGLMLALDNLFPGYSPREPLPKHMRMDDDPAACALAVLVDGIRDALNGMLEEEHIRECVGHASE